jgi:hypothetical protein
MNNEPFEDQIRRQPFRTMPGSWKAQILRKASEAASETTHGRPGRPARGWSWESSWWNWLWPHPVAWAGLIALWLGLATCYWIPQERPAGRAQTGRSASAEEMLILHEQQRRWAELVAIWRSGPPEAAKPDPHLKSRPRSQSYENIILRVG